MNSGRVGRILSIQNHPNADNLDLINVLITAIGQVGPHNKELVTGKHYRIGDLGIWIPPGGNISGWLANDLWLVGKKRRNEPFEVRSISIRGVESPGLWVGSWYRKDKSEESTIRASEHFYHGTLIDHEGYIKWPWWDDNWKVGDVVFDLDKFDPRPLSSGKEQPVANRTVAVERSALGANPAVGSNEKEI